MSDFAAVSERETINAEWIMGSPRKQEVMLFADEGEGRTSSLARLLLRLTRGHELR